MPRNRRAIISQPAKQRYRYVPDITRPYADFIGRRLSVYERRIVHALELKRRANEPARFLIYDQDPYWDSKRVIIRYVDWASRDCGHTPILYVPSVKAGKEFLKNAPLLRKPLLFSHRSPNGVRARTFNHAIITDAPRKFKTLDDEICAIVPPLSITEFSVFIIHTRRPIRRLPPIFVRAIAEAPDVGIFDESDLPGVVIIELRQLYNPAASPPMETHAKQEEHAPLPI